MERARVEKGFRESKSSLTLPSSYMSVYPHPHNNSPLYLSFPQIICNFPKRENNQSPHLRQKEEENICHQRYFAKFVLNYTQLKHSRQNIYKLSKVQQVIIGLYLHLYGPF